MFDTVADAVRTETAIHGRKGITPTELWEIVGKTVSKIASSINEKYANNPPLIDDAYKRCFWPIVVRDKHLEFYEDLDAIVEESSEPQPPTETTTESQPSTSTAPSEPAANPEETAVTEESEPQPTKRKAAASAKGRGPAKKAKAPRKKPARKAAKKPAKKAKKTSYNDDDDEYSSEGYEPPSDDEESTDDEEDYDELESEEDEEEEEEESEEEKAPEPAKKAVGVDDLLQSNTKTNYRQIQDITELNYDQAQKVYGSRLRIVAEEELQTEQLYVGIPPTGRSISTNLQIVLAAILQCGPKGITQATLTKALDLDPRSAGHYVKTLEQKGAIVRKPVSHQGFRTNICIHSRYSKQSATDGVTQDFNAYNVNAMGVAFTPKRLQTRITALLIDAKDNVMYTDDILNALGFTSKSRLVKKWYHRAIDDLCSRNVFRKVIGAGTSTKTRTSRCVQLVDPEEAARALKSSVKTTLSKFHMQLEDDMWFKGGAGLVLKLRDGHQQVSPGQYYDSTVESQIVDVLAAAGTKGATQKEIMFLLSFGEQKAMHKTLEVMESIKQAPASFKYMCSRSLEFEGRLRRYRYYSYQAYRKLKDDVDIEVTGPPLYEIPTSKLKEINFKAREDKVPPARGTNPEKSNDSSTNRSKLQRKKAPHQDDEFTEPSSSEPSSSQSANLAPIFQRQRRTTKRTTDEETGQSELTSSEPVTRKRTRRVSVAAQETTQETTKEVAEPPTKKKRGRPRKQPLNAESTVSQLSSQTELPASSEPQVPSEPPTPAEPPVKKRRGRPPKNSLKATSTSSAPSEPPSSSEPQIASESSAADEEPMKDTSTSSQQSVPAETPVTRKRGRASKKSLNATQSSSEPPKNVDTTESQPEAQAAEQASELSAPSASGSQPTKKQSAEVAAPSPQTGTASPRRGNLFDYFSSSRNSPGPSSPGRAQTDQRTVTEPLPSTPRSPGTLDQQLDEASQDDQQETGTASQQTVKATTNSNSQKAKPGKNSEKGKRIARSVVGENIVRTKSGIVSARHLRSTNNTYQEQRQKVLLAMLQTKSIYERTYELKGEYIAKMKEMYPEESVPPGLCLKTLWRTAKELEELGHAKIIDTTISSLSGKKTTKSILVRNDVDIDSPEVQEHLMHTKDKQSLRPIRVQKLAKFARLDSEVERLEERLERMEEQYNALSNKKGVDAMRMEEEIKELKANMSKATVLEQKMIQDTKYNPRNWLVIATQFGFINARMIRIKMLHQYMFGLLSEDIQGVNQETKTIRTTTLISWMTLGKLCQLVGIVDPKEELLEYTKDPENLEKHIWELPLPIRKAVFESSTKFRWHMRGYLDFMETLGLVKSVFHSARPARLDDAPSTLADSYQILTNVALVDYRTEHNDIVNNYTFTTASDLMIYWSELQYICTNIEAPLTSANIENQSGEVKALVRALSAPKNWTTNHIINRELRDKLNFYIDKSARRTPYGNLRLCKQIAQELRVSEILVFGYYKKMALGFERKRRVFDNRLVQQLEGTVKKRRAARKRNTLERNSVNMATTRVFQRTTRGSTKRRLLQAKALTEDTDNGEADTSKPFLDDEHEIPVIDNNTQVENFRLRRVDRKNWKANEDELLIYCYVIMKHHANVNDRRFLWNVATPLFPGRNASSCKNRIDKLRSVPSIAEYMHRLSILWPELYEKGLEEGAFMAEKTEALGYDILARLTYLIQRLQDVESTTQESSCRLPSTVAIVHAEYTVKQALASAKKVSLEDQFHSTSTLRSKNTALVSSFLTLRSFQTSKLDTLEQGDVGKIDIHTTSLELLKIFFKMSLLTPIEVYDPFFAYAVINKQPPSAVNAAISEMRRKGMIVKAKTEREMDRRLPGTFLSISKKFLHEMACHLPDNFFSQAREYNRFLNVHQKSMFMPILVSSGMMGCILDMMSQDKMEINVHDKENVQRKYQTPIHRHRKTDQSIMDFDLELEVADIKPEVDDIRDKSLSFDISPRSSKVSILTPERMEIEWSGFYSSQAPGQRPLLKTIMDYLQQVKEAGATLVDIKDKILETLTETKDREIIDCIDMLRSTKPPFVHLVGFDTLRYVTTAHLGNWIIDAQDVNALVPTSSELSELARSLAGKRASVIDPRLWIDVNGDVTTMILEECLQVVFQHIMERPGVSESELRRLFDSLLSYAEIKDLLDILIARDAVRKTVVVFSGSLKPTMFSKPRTFTKVDPDTIDRTAQTSYVAQPGYYQKLSLA